ncbi:hypothetical protein HAX54_042360 [Datura stramonium]|uniref:Uncharacterized protein n=1 Tax=Datura stramonium TaxID=4076 RepID=A0ABS8W326_DATST|nr:hypothetical protein [Datura stramonium]
MGGQMQQSNPAATAVYDHPGNAGPVGDAGDVVMARWLQSAGLQHLASSLASTGVDHRLLPNLLMQILRIHTRHVVVILSALIPLVLLVGLSLPLTTNVVSENTIVDYLFTSWTLWFR